MSGKPREHWASSFGFVMAAAGSAIGLGTLWQFPYMTGANGGGLFNWSRKKAVLISAIACYIFGIPSALSGAGLLFPNWEAMYGKTFFGTIVDLVAQWILPVVGLFVAIFAGWYMRKADSYEEFSAGSNWGKFFFVWRFFTRWVAPIAIIVIILQRAEIIDLDQIFSAGQVEEAPVQEISSK